MKKKLLFVVAGGGFFFESKMLIDKFLFLDNQFDIIFLATDGADKLKLLYPNKKVYKISVMFNLSMKSILLKILRFMRAFIQSAKVVRKEKPDAVIWIGDALGLPTAICGKLYGAKVVYIESITRLSTPSLTGKIIDRLCLSDRIYVQWPEIKALYKKAIYEGWVL